MSTPTWGLDPKARRISVYYFGESTIYEGMPVCYDNSTTNWMGVDGSKIDFTTTASTASLESTTTADGYQNEGKYIRVENPNADNVGMFAGVVAGADHAGETGPLALDIYVANGAVVPVRTDNTTLADQTILAITTGSQELGVPLATDSRPVAIAREAVSSTGLCLAELCPYRFVFQDSGGTALSVDDADTGSDSVVNKIYVDFIQATGNCTALWVQAESSAGAVANGYGLALYVQADVTATVASHVAGCGIWMNVTGGTPAEYLTPLEVGLYEDGATMTSAGRVSVLALSMQVADDVTANNLGWLYLAQNGAQAADDFILSSNLAALPAVVFTGDVSLSGQYGIKVYLANQAGTQQWYIPLVNTLSD